MALIFALGRLDELFFPSVSFFTGAFFVGFSFFHVCALYIVFHCLIFEKHRSFEDFWFSDDLAPWRWIVRFQLSCGAAPPPPFTSSAFSAWLDLWLDPLSCDEPKSLP